MHIDETRRAATQFSQGTLRIKGVGALSRVDQGHVVVQVRRPDPDRPEGLHVNWHHAHVAGPAFIRLKMRDRGLGKKMVAEHLVAIAHGVSRELGDNPALLRGFETAIEAALAEKNETYIRDRLERVFEAIWETVPEDFDWTKVG